MVHLTFAALNLVILGVLNLVVTVTGLGTVVVVGAVGCIFMGWWWVLGFD
jgi:hypothetical protein